MVFLCDEVLVKYQLRVSSIKRKTSSIVDEFGTLSVMRFTKKSLSLYEELFFFSDCVVNLETVETTGFHA